MARRGSYAKGIAKREEILEASVRVIARYGYRKTSVKELADEVGLSQAGLLHYFDSKEALFGEIVRKRDDIDMAELGAETDHPIEALKAAVRHNASVPGLVQLYAMVSTEACDPAHPAHDYFVNRYRYFRELGAEQIRELQSAGEVAADLDPERTASLIFAVADGLQVQWMLDPEISMSEHIDALWTMLTR